MKLGDVLQILAHCSDINPGNVFIKKLRWSEIDFTDSEMISLGDAPVYHYFNNGDGTILIETMWS